MKPTIITLLTCLVLGSSLAVAQQPLQSASAFSTDRQQLCQQQWSNTGSLNERLFDACIDQQRAAYFELRSMNSFYSGQAFYRNYALPYCQRTETRDGNADAQLMVFCLQEEIRGYEDVQDYLQRYRSQRVRDVVNTALTSTGSWSIAASRVKSIGNVKMVRDPRWVY